VAVDREQVFDDDYLYFYETWLTDEMSDRQSELIWRLLELEPGMEVLDLACGHGRIANRLATRGAHVTGLDATPLFLERASADAAARGVEVEYVEGDMRSLLWEERFDRVVCWFTSFGYFDDDDNGRVLAAVHRALKPAGRLLIDVHNLPGFIKLFRPTDVIERNGDFLIDNAAFDPLSGRMKSERIMIRGGRTRRVAFEVREFTFTELRSWLVEAGFGAVDGYGRDGEPLTLDHPRMIVIARKP